MNADTGMFADVLHVGFTVTDIERSVDWYGRVLGLELIHRQRSDNDYIRTLVGVSDAVLEVAQFALPGSPPRFSTHVLELIEYVEGAGEHAGGIGVNQAGTAHLGFVVTDIHAKYRQLVAEGVDFVNPPVAVTEGANVGGYACYLRDPDGIALEFDGIALELMQFAPERARRLGIALPSPS
jgi:lactoylglutathione lyase